MSNEVNGGNVIKNDPEHKLWMEKALWYKMLDDKEYKIARSAWGFFLKAHRDECDMDVAIDTIAEGVLEIADKELWHLV